MGYLGDQILIDKGQQEQDKTSVSIFTDDRNWLDESDLVVAEMTQPSFGVGYETERTETRGKNNLSISSDTWIQSFGYDREQSYL